MRSLPLLVAVVLEGCSSGGKPAVQTLTPVSASAPEPGLSQQDSGPAALLTQEPAPELPAPGESVTFTEGAPIRFHPGAPLTLKPIAKQTSIVGLSPDARSWVLDWSGASLVTPASPTGYAIGLSRVQSQFSQDGALVLVWGNGGLEVIEVATGRTLDTHRGTVCAARFASKDEIVWHSESQRPEAYLFRKRIGVGSPTRFRIGRPADFCQASLDGSLWLTESYHERHFVDGRTGVGTLIPKRGTEEAKLSSAGNRYCYAEDKPLVCVRFPDRRQEQVWSKPTSEVLFEIEGTQAVITYAGDSDGIYDDLALVDFQQRNVRPLRGAKPTSGSLFRLQPGGKLLTIGSSSGLYVYDLERGRVRFAAHRPLYGHFGFAYNQRRLVAGTDEPMDLFLVEVP